MSKMLTLSLTERLPGDCGAAAGLGRPLGDQERRRRHGPHARRALRARAVVDALCKRGSNVHAPGFDSIGPIDYALNKKNAYLSDVLMKHDTSSPKQPILGHMTSCSLPLQDKTNSIQERDEDLIMDSSNLNLHSASTPLDLSQQESAAAANTCQDLLDNSSAEQRANNSQ